MVDDDFILNAVTSDTVFLKLIFTQSHCIDYVKIISIYIGGFWISTNNLMSCGIGESIYRDPDFPVFDGDQSINQASNQPIDRSIKIIHVYS